MAKPVIIYDFANKLVWVDGAKPVRGGKGEERYYGKYGKRFTSNVQARGYAIRLAKGLGGNVWNRSTAKMHRLKNKTLGSKQKQDSSISFKFGYPRSARLVIDASLKRMLMR